MKPTYIDRSWGYTSLRNMQASLLWRYRKNLWRSRSAPTVLSPISALKTPEGLRIFRWNIAQQSWVLESILIWREWA